MDHMCPERHYWPGQCQQCDTAWNALSFACQIAGHAWRYDVGDEGWECPHCGTFRSHLPAEAA